MKKLLVLIMCSMFSFAGLAAPNSNPMEVVDFNPFLKSIEQLSFPSSDYFKQVTDKDQATLHHTASGKGIRGDYRTFLKPGKIATPIIIGHDTTYQLFSSRYWAYHLGIKAKVFKALGLSYKNLNKTAIGIEIDSWGPLKLVDGEYRTYINDFGEGTRTDKHGNKLIITIDKTEVTTYEKAYRGYNHYQSYNSYQIDTVKTLLQYWNLVYNIPLDYKEDMWDVSTNALKGEPGVWTHNSYRKDKSDCHPQPELIAMLKSLV